MAIIHPFINNDHKNPSIMSIINDLAGDTIIDNSFNSVFIKQITIQIIINNLEINCDRFCSCIVKDLLILLIKQFILVQFISKYKKLIAIIMSLIPDDIASNISLRVMFLYLWLYIKNIIATYFIIFIAYLITFTQVVLRFGINISKPKQ